jgi:hypothetical protein
MYTHIHTYTNTRNTHNQIPSFSSSSLSFLDDSFNKREEDFSDKQAWDDYLEALEDIGEFVYFSR